MCIDYYQNACKMLAEYYQDACKLFVNLSLKSL